MKAKSQSSKSVTDDIKQVHTLSFGGRLSFLLCRLLVL